MQTNKIFSLIAAVALTITVSAQQSEHDNGVPASNTQWGVDNYVGVNFGGGLNSMLYKPANGTQGLGFGFDAGIHYGHFFNRTVGLGVGLQYSWANAYATYNWSETTTGLTHPDNPNTPYNLTTGFNNFVERQNVGYLSIPVEVLFRKSLNDRAAFIGGVGLALDLPIHGKYIAKGGSYSTTGVFPEVGSYVFSDMPEHGFTTYTTTQGARFNNRAKVGGSVIADLGFRVALNDNWGMYFGVYAGYGFTNLLASAKTEEMIMVNVTDPSVIDYRGTFDSNETSKANLIRCGAKIAIDFGWNDKVKTVEADPVVLEPAPEPIVEPVVDESAERHNRFEQYKKEQSAACAAMAQRDDSDASKALIAQARKNIADLAYDDNSSEEANRARVNALKEPLSRDLAAQREADRQAREQAARAARIAALKAKGETVNVHFDIAGANMHFQEDEQTTVDEICEVMANDPSMKIVITGHTDNTGNAEQNLNYFGMKRAEALRDYMVEKGVPSDQIRCESKGQTEPVADNATPEGRALNRRANIRFE